MYQCITQVFKKEDASRRKTVFVDRDGTLNREVNYLSHLSQFQFLPNVSQGIKKLNRYNVVVIIVTNQPVIARGLATIRDITVIHDNLVHTLHKEHAYINAIYFCPHHPEKNHSDIPPHAMEYRVACECRKPKVAMLKKAVEDFHIDLEKAYIVGDRTEDIKAGKNLGITTLLVETGYGGRDKKYSVVSDYIARDFAEAVDIIISD